MLLELAYAQPWATKSFLVALGLVPLMVGIPVLSQLGLPSHLTLIAWGTGCLLFLLQTASLSGVSPQGWLVFGVMIGIGYLIGGPMNLLSGQAALEAPNPGIAQAITSVSPLLTMVVFLLLQHVWPHLRCEPLSHLNIAGVILLIVGVGLILHK